jgi:hypothetical protein
MCDGWPAGPAPSRFYSTPIGTDATASTSSTVPTIHKSLSPRPLKLPTPENCQFKPTVPMKAAATGPQRERGERFAGYLTPATCPAMDTSAIRKPRTYSP